MKPDGDGELPLGVFERGRSRAAERCSSPVDRVIADGRSNVGAASDVWSDDAIFSNGGCEEKPSHQSQMGFLGSWFSFINPRRGANVAGQLATSLSSSGRSLKGSDVCLASVIPEPGH